MSRMMKGSVLNAPASISAVRSGQTRRKEPVLPLSTNAQRGNSVARGGGAVHSPESIVVFSEFLASVELDKRRNRFYFVAFLFYCALTAFTAFILIDRVGKSTELAYNAAAQETRRLSLDSWSFKTLEVIDVQGILQTFVFKSKRPLLVPKTFEIEQRVLLQPNTYKSWRRYLEAGSTVVIDFSLEAEANLPGPVSLSDALVVCAMESSRVADWLNSESSLTLLCSDSKAADVVADIQRREQSSGAVSYTINSLKSTEITFLVEYHVEPAVEGAAEANPQTPLPLHVALNMSLLLYDLNAADDFFAGSFIRDLDLFESTRTSLILNNPSSKRSIDVSVRFTPRQLPWILLFVLGQCIFFLASWMALRVLSTRWAAQIAALRDHRDT